MAFGHCRTGLAELQLVHRYLDCDLYGNALFLVDRFRAAEPDNATWVHLQALCSLRLGRFLAACDYSRERALAGEHMGCAYVFAQGCLQLGHCRDGIQALERTRRSSSPQSSYGDNWSSLGGRFIPDVAAVSVLLGKLHRANSDLQNAANSFVAALEADAFMWDAFTSLCDCGSWERECTNVQLQLTGLGISLDVANVFQPKAFSAKPSSKKSLAKSIRTNIAPQSRADAGGDGTAAAISPLEPTLRQPSTRVLVELRAKRKQGPAAEGFATEAVGTRVDSRRLESTSSTNELIPQRRSARLRQPTNATRAKSVERNGAEENLKHPEKLRVAPNSKEQRGLDSDSKRSSAKSKITTKVSQDQKPNPKSKAPKDLKSDDPPEPSSNTIPDEGCSEYLFELFLKFGTAYYHLKQFQPRACLNTLTSLPVEQQATPWVLSKTARSQYDLLSYKDSRSTFQVLRNVAPSWVEDLEVYSTVLWHLKDDVLLAFHAHELVDNHYLSPQAWCAVGNSLSLQKSHHEAIRAFRRATQLAPPLAHAYSLLGHEHCDLEEYDEANQAFRRALNTDARHYTAWVGLGRVQETLGQHERALQYYIQAEKIHPENIVVLASIARVFDKLGNPQRGLAYLGRSSLADTGPLSALAKVQAARIFLRLGSASDAITQLEAARAAIPDEAELHLLLGQAHRLLGDEHRGEALQSFTVALSLRPSSQAIKDAMSSLEEQG